MEIISGWMLVIAICGPIPDDCRDEPVDMVIHDTKADCERISGARTTDPDAVCIDVQIARPFEDVAQ